MCVSEHWLSNDQVDYFCPMDFVVADVMCRVLHKNGGTAIFVKESIQFEKIDVSEFNSEIDCELSCIKLIDYGIVIISIYRSPNGNVQIFFQLFEKMLRKVCKNKIKVVVCGDFNIEMSNLDNNLTINFLNLLRSLNLTCTNKHPTRHKSCIDNILVNFSDKFINEAKVIPGCLADHDPLFFRITIPHKNSQTEIKKSKVSFRKQTDVLINTFLNMLNEEKWEIFSEYELNYINLETLCQQFFKKIVELWHFCSPIIIKYKWENGSHTVNKKLRTNWYSDSLRQDKNRMMAYYDIYNNLRRIGSDHMQVAYRVYIGYKKMYRSSLNRAKKQTYERYIEESTNKCKAAWEIIKNQNTSNNSKSTIFDPETLNSYFLDTIQELGKNFNHGNSVTASCLMDPTLKYSTVFSWNKISQQEIVQTVKKFSNSKAMDYFSLSNFILKRTIHSISEPLAYIFNECLYKGYFPEILKVSKVIPVFKKGDKNLLQNYRPVSIVPIFSKIFESLILNQVSTFFESNNLLTDCQFGFRSNRSTTHAVQELIEEVLMAFERQESVSVLLFDLSKAFDCIPIDILINKLEYYGITGNVLSIFESYLCNRKQYVSIKGKTSTFKEVKSGVPQGSVLGPFLFIIAINDLPANIPIHSVIYADDTTIFSSGKDSAQLQNVMRGAQNSVLDWFKSNKLVCNQEKTQNLVFSLNKGSNIQSVKLLGFNLDTKLNWNVHISEVCKKLSRVIYLFWKLKPLVSHEYLRTAYFGMFQSHLQYGIFLWGHSANTHEILLLQKKVIRIMMGKSPMEHCKPLFINQRILTIINLYIFTILMYTKKNINTFITRNNIHEHNTRQGHLIDIPQYRLTKTGKCFKVLCVKFFNKLPETARLANFDSFKVSVYNWLIQNPFYSIDEFLETSINITFK